jgi:hypothetical protein
VVLEGLLDSVGGGGADALVDRQCLRQVHGGLAGSGVLQVALAESFQGACFLQGRADVAGDGQGLGVMLASLRSVRGPGRELAEAVECLSLAEPVAEVTKLRQGPLVAGSGGRVVPGLLLHDAQAVEGLGLASQVAEVAPQRQGLPLAGSGGRVVPGLLLHDGQAVEGLGLAF